MEVGGSTGGRGGKSPGSNLTETTKSRLLAGHHDQSAG